MDFNDTIAAVSTPPGVGGIAVIRVSGKDAIEITDRLWRGKSLSQCDSHTAHLGEIVDTDGDMIDTAVATIYRGPHSFTGDDTVELSLHGSTWIQQEVLNMLVEAGARVASAGEFTRRAFVNGRLDLAQAEGIADMISASSRANLRLATRQMKGEFSTKLNLIREEMVTLASLLELELDFSEEDVEFADRGQLRKLSESLMAEIDRLASTFRTGRAIKNGVSVVIAGCPNAGKSTLLNQLVGEEKAIVSDIAGTTRDVIEDIVEIDGVLFRFADTAGLRDSEDEIENIGIERAKKYISSADIILCLIDGSANLTSQVDYLKQIFDFKGGGGYDEEDKYQRGNAYSRELSEASVSEDSPEIIYVLNKSDLMESQPELNSPVEKLKNSSPIIISAKEGNGLNQLRVRLVEAARGGLDLQSELIVTNVRHYESLKETRRSLARFLTSIDAGLSGDLLSQDLREAIHHLGTITGTITTDTLLQTIFSRFCIGK